MQTPPGNSPERIKTSLSFMLGLRQAERALALLPFAAFLQKLDTFKTLQDGTLAAYGTGCFEAGMLGHDLVFVKGSEKYYSKKELFAKKVVSEFDLKTAENSYLTAKAGLAQAKAQEVSARNNLSYTEVKSPSDGVIGTLPYRVGALVSASLPQPLTTVSDNSDIRESCTSASILKN